MIQLDNIISLSLENLSDSWRRNSAGAAVE